MEDIVTIYMNSSRNKRIPTYFRSQHCLHTKAKEVCKTSLASPGNLNWLDSPSTQSAASRRGNCSSWLHPFPIVTERLFTVIPTGRLGKKLVFRILTFSWGISMMISLRANTNHVTIFAFLLWLWENANWVNNSTE